MKKGKGIKKSIAIFMCGLLMLTTFVGCGDDKKPPVPVEATVESIAIDTAAVKKTFAYLEPFTYAGLKVTATMSDKTTKDVATKDCSISTPDMSKPGDRNVTVTYKRKTARYTIKVNEKVVPPIDAAVLLDITGENADNAYRVEAEKINMAISGAKAATGDSFVTTITEPTTPGTSDMKYLNNFGVAGNYFGFTFKADKTYEGVTLAMQMAFNGAENLALNESIKMYHNYISMADSGELVDLQGQTLNVGVAPSETGWKDIVLRGLTIPAGVNTLTIEVLGTKVPNIDYFDFYVGSKYQNTNIELAGKGIYVKDFEDFDLEKIVNRQDMIDAHNLKPGECYIEPAANNLDGTSRGTCPAGFTTGTQISTTIKMVKDATVRISIAAAAVDSYKIKDNWEFTIDGVKLEKIQDKEIKDSVPGAPYWEWHDTSLGITNLQAGDHLFIAKVTGSHCNVDTFKFEVLTYGEYATSLDDANIIINEAGVKKTVEAEELTYSLGSTREVPGGNAYHITSGYRSIGGIAGEGKAGNTFSFTINSGAVAKAKLNMSVAYGGESLVFDDFVEVKVGETVVKSNATLTKDEGAVAYLDGETEIKKFAPQNGFYYNWKIVPIAIDLVAGINTITFTVKTQAEGVVSQAPNFDKFDVVVTKYGTDPEVTIPKIMKEDCHAVITGEGVYRVEAEHADLSEVALALPNLNAGHHYAEMSGGKAFTSGTSVGKLANLGNVIKVYIYSDVAYDKNVKLTLSMAVGDDLKGEPKRADDLLTFKLNGSKVTAGDKGLLDGNNEDNKYWNWNMIAINGLSLKAGLNTFTIAIESELMAPNMDYFDIQIGA